MSSDADEYSDYERKKKMIEKNIEIEVDKQIEITSRSKQLANNAVVVTEETNERLVNQNERLDRLNDKLLDTKEDLKESKAQTKKIKWNVFGFLVKPFKSKKKRNLESQKVVSNPESKVGASDVKTDNKGESKFTNISGLEKENQVGENLKDINKALDKMQQLSAVQNKELKNQGEKLDKFNDNVKDVDQELQKQTDDLKKLNSKY
ncbi:MAG: hypothetical protein MHMPM18_002223 [Marteilia pararefringens]